jgi:hypothetical protein
MLQTLSRISGCQHEWKVGPAHYRLACKVNPHGQKTEMTEYTVFLAYVTGTVDQKSRAFQLPRADPLCEDCEFA